MRRVIAKSVPKRNLSGIRGAQSPDFVGFERFGWPDVVAIEADELPLAHPEAARPSHFREMRTTP